MSSAFGRLVGVWLVAGCAWSVAVAGDTLPDTAAWTAESNWPYAAFGKSVASAGDVNCDGLADVIVGAEGYGGSHQGRAYVYLGSAVGLGTTAAWTVDGGQVDSFFGFSVASAGDVDGDGCDDVIVGAPYGANGEPNEGLAFVYLGSVAGLSTTPAWSAESDQDGALFGFTVASAGDVNDDGYDDVAVGAVSYDGGAIDEGRVSVYLGGPAGLGAAPAWTAQSGQSYSNFGGALGAGDVNGDGYSDLVVGMSAYSNAEASEGATSVYLGSSFGLAAGAAWTVESNAATARFGSSVAAADVDGDGYDDVVVGASGYDNGQSDEGAAFLFLGSPAGLAAGASWSAESDQALALLGWSVASAGDVDGDGFDDVLVGAFGFDGADSDEGRASLYLGSAAGLQASAVWTASSGQASAYFGISVAGAGDVNGDGLDDVLVGASAFDGGSSDEGRAYLFAPDRQYFTDADGDGFGDPTTAHAASAPGDVLDDTDCDDTNAAISPAATEVCDPADVDEDCDGLADDADDSVTGRQTHYLDDDFDGYGGALAGDYCDPPGALLLSSTDCDDDDPTRHPGAVETDCQDPTDYNCDGSAGSEDLDGDGFPACEDCNDADSDWHPRAPESNCTNPNDYNCDGSVGTTDADADGAIACLDCDDDDATTHSGAVEIVGDGLDQDCDGSELCFVDADGDGYRPDDSASEGSGPACDGPGEADEAIGAGDCDDSDADRHPGAPEPDCTDPVDYNCDGSVAFADEDGDGFAACRECDDRDAAVNPDADEICNHLDDDCDGTTDVDPIELLTWYVDSDSDGFTSRSQSVQACDPPEGFAAETEEDCDDRDDEAFPGAREVPDDGVDQDCDGRDAEEKGGGCGCTAAPQGLGWPVSIAAIVLALGRRRP